MIDNYEEEIVIDNNSDIIDNSSDIIKKCKYDIVICEIHNEHLHGLTEESDATISGHYIVSFKTNCKTRNYNYFNLNEILSAFVLLYKKKYKLLKKNIKYNIYCKHPLIRNYKNIIENKNYIKPEIGECFYLKGGECIVIIKTFWIRIIQRVWRKICKERKQILEKRKLYNSIKFRELRGSWKKPYITSPGIYGMLSFLKRNKKN